MSATKRRVVRGSIAEKFAQRMAGVTPNSAGCLEWPAARNDRGYGQIWDDTTKRITYAHRVSWEVTNGRPIPDGLYILHSCDNPPCCNPDHLRTGTPLENSRDAVERDRVDRSGKVRGERHGNAKLTVEAVVEARRLYRQGMRLDEVADRLGVARESAFSAITGRTWAHVTEEPPVQSRTRPRPRPRLKPIRHGTDNGYAAHLRRGVPACADCRAAHAAAVAWRAEARALRSPEDGER